MNPLEENVLVSMRVRDAHPENVVPGSTQRPCAKCGEAVWVSPSSAAVVVTATLCIPCAIPVINADPQPDFRVASGAPREIRDHLTRN